MILALDLGSTTFKAALFDDALARVGGAEGATPYLKKEQAAVELDPEAVWTSLLQLMHKTVAAAGFSFADVQRVAVTSQAQTFCIADSAGRARTAFISWLDTRAGGEAQELWEKFGVDFGKHCSFARPSGQLQLCQIRRLLKSNPKLFDNGGRILTLPGLVFHRLANLWICDANLGAMNGLYSLEMEGPWRDALEFCGIPDDALPSWVAVGTGVQAQVISREWGGGRMMTFVSAGNDQTAGAYGAGCEKSDVLATLGTALVAYRVVADKSLCAREAGCWGPYLGGLYYQLAFRDEGCLALDFAREKLMPNSSVSAFLDAAKAFYQRCDECSWFFFPELIRSGRPWLGGGDEAFLPYAVVEGISFSLKRLIQTELHGGESRRILLAGGGARSLFWRQMLADVLDTEVEEAGGDSLFGAARMVLDVGGFCQPVRSVARPDRKYVARLARRYREWEAKRAVGR